MRGLKNKRGKEAELMLAWRRFKLVADQVGRITAFTEEQLPDF